MPSSRIPPDPARHPLMVVVICGKYGNNRSRTENVTERTRFSKSRSNDLEDIGQGQRSSRATHLLMLVIICAKYKKNPFRTVDATERTQFSKSRPNDLEDIGQGQRSSHATHPLMLLIICTKYGKNPSWTVDATGRTRKVNGQTDGQTGWIQYTPPPPPPPPPPPTSLMKQCSAIKLAQQSKNPPRVIIMILP